MNDNYFDEKMKYIAMYYGLHNQTIKLGEEMGELFRAVSGYLDGRNGRESVEEELADVYIMLMQIRTLTNVNDVALCEIMNKKADRQIQRIAEERAKK